MKTPSQRKRGAEKRKRFLTQLELDIRNGFDASRYLQPSAANYRTVKNAMDEQRKKFEKENKTRAKKIADEKAKIKRRKEQAKINRKTKTLFDVIDIE